MQACISHNVSASLSISGLRQVLLLPLVFAALAYNNVPLNCRRYERKYSGLGLTANKAFVVHNPYLRAAENHFHHRRQRYAIFTAIHRNKMYGRGIKGTGTAYIITPSEITRDNLSVKSKAGFSRVRKFSKCDTYLVYRHFCVSAWNNSAPTGRVFIKCYI